MDQYTGFDTTNNAKRFDTEEQAEDFAEKVLIEHGFTVFRQVEITPHGRVDIVAKKWIDDKRLILPVEVKSWFHGPGIISKAAAQASYYAHHKNIPFFLGPLYDYGRKYDLNLHSYLSFMCRGNVGAMTVENAPFQGLTNLRFYLEPHRAVYERYWNVWDAKWVEKVNWHKWGMRTQNRSKAVFQIKAPEVRS